MIERIDVWVHGSVEPEDPGGAMVYAYIIKVNGAVRENVAIFEDYRAEHTSPLAEYTAISHALGYLLKSGMERHQVRIRSDNLMVVRQMNGLWKTKDPLAAYIPHQKVAKMLAGHFRDASFTWILRKENAEVREMARMNFMSNGISVKEEGDEKEARAEGV